MRPAGKPSTAGGGAAFRDTSKMMINLAQGAGLADDPTIRQDLVRLYTSGQFSCEIRLVLRDDEAPGMELGRSGRLGWTSWLGRRTGMADDVVLQGDKYH